MENQRLILVIALGLVLFLIWQAWMEEQMALNPPPAQTSLSTPSATAPDSPGQSGTGPVAGDVPLAPGATAASAVPSTPATGTSQRIKVITDQYVAEIDTRGGSLVHAGLLQYPESLQQPDQPFALLSDNPVNLFIAESGLQATAGIAPGRDQVFQAAQTEYKLADGQNSLEVPLSWSDESGLTITKIYTFHRDRFTIDVVHRIENSSDAEWRGSQYRELVRRPPNESRGLGAVYTYTGGVISTPEQKYEKIDFGDMAETNLDLDVAGGWIAMIQHYFLGAWIPAQDELNKFYSRALGDGRYRLGMVSAEQTVAAGQTGTFATQLYVGPKIQERLEGLAPNLSRTVDYGWLWFIAEPLFVILKWLHGLLGNWGWSIILLTVMIKAVFFKLSETSYRSMANMRKLAPKLQQMKERYGDDRAKLNQAMMEMYKKEKINPLGGCLPILVQIPVFIALYWMLLESVELRQAPWLGWIQDLSTKDPYYILPLIMGVSMFIQQRLNPTPPDPIQAKVMMALPVVFTFFFLWFPSGLVLYWVVNNVLSITQQYIITKRVEAGTAKT
ncbi:MAG: membrane protein insertase YidC [Gammaproteobacteria bacterium]